MIFGLLALTSSALFLGAAAYVLFVEHVAREALDDRAALTEWKPAYRRGAMLQAPLALLTTVLAAIAWWQTGYVWFGVGAICALLPWPWTLLVIKPTNDKLLRTAMKDAGIVTRRLLKTWGHLHAVRMSLGAAATISVFIALAHWTY